MYQHFETYRLLAKERMNQYQSEAAAERRIRLAAARGGQENERPTITAPARMMRAMVRAFLPHAREKRTACGESGRSAV